MRWRVALLVLAVPLVLAETQCGRSSPVSPSTRIIVFVHWGQMPISGIRVEVLPTGRSRTTGADGIVEFEVAPGDYTVRVYGINTAGPPPLYVDFPAHVQPGQPAIIDVVDCLPCESADGAR